MFKDVIWDFDGTLFDTYPNTLTLFLSILTAHGIHASREELELQAKITIGRMFQYCTDRYGATQDLFDEFNRREPVDNMAVNRPYPYALDAVKAVAAAGGRNFLYTHRGAEANTYLQAHGFAPYFTEVVCRENGFASKPSPDAVLYLINQYGMEPEQTLMVGDRSIDILSGKNAGIRTCYFDSDGRNESMPTDYKVTSLAQLLAILQ